LPTRGNIFFSVRDQDKLLVWKAAKKLSDLGFKILATQGTESFLRKQGVEVALVYKVGEGSPHIVEKIIAGEIAMVVNTPEGKKSAYDSFSIRRNALTRNVPYFTTAAAAVAAVDGIETLLKKGLTVKPMQEFYKEAKIILN